MSEVAALNAAWSQYKKAADLPGTVYWSNGYQKWTYPAKAIFDSGWEAAMEWKERNPDA